MEKTVLGSRRSSSPPMLLAQVVTTSNADLIAFVKEKMKDRVPSDVDSKERPDLILLAKGIIEKETQEQEQASRATHDSPNSPVPANPTGSLAEKIETEQDALHALRVMGFDTKEQVKAYLKGVEREKEKALQRVAAIDEMHKALELREIKCKKRESDIDAKGKKVLADLLELRALRDENAEILRHKKALASLN